MKENLSVNNVIWTRWKNLNCISKVYSFLDSKDSLLRAYEPRVHKQNHSLQVVISSINILLHLHYIFIV